LSPVAAAKPVPDPAGNPPDLRLELPQRLVCAAAGVLAVAVLAIAAFGAWRAAGDTEQEMAGAVALATLLQGLQSTATLDDTTLVAQLQAQQQRQPLRHLQLALLDDTGALRLGQLPAPAADTTPPLRWAMARPAGAPWTLLLGPSPDSERQEAWGGLLPTLALTLGFALLVLLLMHHQLHRALRPLRALLAVIERPRNGEPLPTMPVRELQALSDALSRAQTARERLGRRLQAVQEQERRWLAQELHDELGQRLTAMRLDATVLQRVAGSPDAAALAGGLAAQADAAQQEVRALLKRLAPQVTGDAPAQLAGLLQELAGAQRGLAVHLALDLGPQPLPRDLATAVYRLSQEGLTNVCRHASATQAWLAVFRHGSLLQWQLRDDGVGLHDLQAASQRGSGLAGMRERAWAWGGDLHLQARPGGGLQLSVDLHTGEVAT